LQVGTRRFVPTEPQAGSTERAVCVRFAKAVFHGYAVPGTGTVPAYPPSKWIPAIQKENGGNGPYPFSVATAKSPLTSHGWQMVNGVMTCETPAKCGTGISKGQKATFEPDPLD
jgi:hypothetical protein